MFRYILYMVVVLFLVSCERTVDVDLPPHTPKMVMHCLFSPDSTFQTALTISQDILEPSEFNFVTDATLSLYEDDDFLETLTPNDFSFEVWDNWGFEQTEKEGAFFTSENVAKVDKTYRLEVSAEGFEDIEATTTVPALVEIEEVQTTNVFTEEGEYLDNAFMNVSFSDPVGDNYYEIRAYADVIYADYEYYFDSTLNDYVPGDVIVTDTFRQEIYLEYNDPLGLDALGSGSSIFLEDGLFEGNTANIKLIVYDNVIAGTEILVELISHSKDSYLYKTSRIKHEWSRDDPFSEPVFVYSNVENGYGVFGAYRVSRFIHTE